MSNEPYFEIIDEQDEDDLIDKLGAIYWIFGTCYEEEFSFKKYRIEFLKTVPPKYNMDSCLLSVEVNIYENDVLMTPDSTMITFYKWNNRYAQMNDIEISSKGPIAYYNCNWFNRLSYSLYKTWNYYFANLTLIEVQDDNYIGINPLAISQKSNF